MSGVTSRDAYDDPQKLRQELGDLWPRLRRAEERSARLLQAEALLREAAAAALRSKGAGWREYGARVNRFLRVEDSADALPDLPPDTADIWCKHGVQTHVRRHCPLCHAEDEEHDRAMAAETVDEVQK